jgi:hypothetical protein
MVVMLAHAFSLITKIKANGMQQVCKKEICFKIVSATL